MRHQLTTEGGQLMTTEEAKQRLEIVLEQYRKGLVTSKEKNDEAFSILYQVLYPEQFGGVTLQVQEEGLKCPDTF